jgi:KRAB domain-containing zinc finger protein
MTEDGNITTDSSTMNCMYCAKKFPSLSSLEAHMALHKFNQTEAEGTTAAAIYGQRTETTTPSDLTISCAVCDKSFATLGQLTSHSRTHNVVRECAVASAPPRPTFKCMFCTKVLTHPSNLKRHIRTAHFESSDMKVYTCETCAKSFKDPSALKQHSNLHLEVRPFPCRVCPKSFGLRSQLETHERVHTGEKP